MTQPTETLLLKQPTLSQDEIAFLYAGDLWTAARDGSQPRRLTAQKGRKASPYYSPDGQWIAFSADYDGSQSVYILPREGGMPRRLTYHPYPDAVRGWTPDGTAVLFSSTLNTISRRVRRLFTVPLEGGLPTPLPMPMAERGDYSPDGQRIAYTPFAEPFWSWKHYRGGMTLPIWLLDLSGYAQIEIPHENASDTFPCWLGETIYFLSDRAGVMNLFRWPLGAQKVEQVTHHADFDVRALTAAQGRLVYEQGGRIHIYDPAAGQSTALHIAIAADLPYTRPHFEHAERYIYNAALSPTGQRAVLEARGDIFTVPAKKGAVRNITHTPAVNERDPAWSPDGQSIAYFSDASGEYELVIADQKGAQKASIPLGQPSFFYSPRWSPDGQKIAFTDKALHLAYVDVAQKTVVAVDADTYDHPLRSLNPAWSPDSQWLAYTRRLNNQIRAVFLYHLADGSTHQVTDGMSDATDACFSRDGKYLFFTASTNYGLNTGWLDMSSFEHAVLRHIYVAVLNQADPSPLAAQSDEEAAPDAPPDEAAPDTADKDHPDQDHQEEAAPPSAKKEAKAMAVQIDLPGLDQRILALPLPPRDYRNLQAIDGKLFYLETRPNQAATPEEDHPTCRLNVYDIKEREAEVFINCLHDYWVSADGKKLMTRDDSEGPQFAIVDTDKKPDPDSGKLDLDNFQVSVDPRAEWQQIFREAFRIHRDFFYDAALHGVDLQAVYQKYLPFLAHVGHRDDLNYLLAEFSGELVVGHAYVGEGDIPASRGVPVGLLGADYEQTAEGYYRITRIYPGLNWHPELRAPLTEPGVSVQAGDYLLAVNGQPLHAPTNLYQLFAHTADRVTDLLVGPTPDVSQARTVSVRPLVSETPLRHWTWVEHNRQQVAERSGGRVGYVYLPDTSVSGYENFNRYYFAQLDKEALVIDERFNGGGSVADYVIDLLDRPLLSFWATREGGVFTTPNASIFGPKVMIINELAGSGGDALPLFFRRRGLGKLVGKRTWGGLIGIYDYPVLMDGGFFTSPRMAIYSPEGEWEVENVGIAPDIEVEMTTQAAAAGHDPQLEKAVEVVLAELAAHPFARKPRPASAHKAE